MTTTTKTAARAASIREMVADTVAKAGDSQWFATKAQANAAARIAGFEILHDGKGESGDHGPGSRLYWKRPNAKHNEYKQPYNYACVSRVGRQWALNIHDGHPKGEGKTGFDFGRIPQITRDLWHKQGRPATFTVEGYTWTREQQNGVDGYTVRNPQGAVIARMNDNPQAAAPASTEAVAAMRAAVSAVHELIKERLDYLAARWQDESEYEDINEYRDVLVKLLPANAKFVAMTKRPFGIKFKVAGVDGVFHSYCTSRKIGWKQVA